MAGTMRFESITGERLIELVDGQYEVVIETPQGLANVKVDTLIEFFNRVVAERLDAVEGILADLDVDPQLTRTLTVNGDVEGSVNFNSTNLVLTLNVPDGALTTAAVNGLSATLLGLRLDVNEALDALDQKQNAADPANTAHKLQTPRRINGVPFDGTSDITVGISVEEAQQIAADKSYIHYQTVPSDTWEINHGLNKFPSVVAVDSAGTEVGGVPEWIDSNTLLYRFSGAMAGKAYVN